MAASTVFYLNTGAVIFKAAYLNVLSEKNKLMFTTAAKEEDTDQETSSYRRSYC